ncbi:hypothetical protein SKAU_G00000080 [Synaphobranchus kaupii]|uniref:Uncharacterized protein n=1 Tax=Synaphobranchus kaupii TaxID=118154 RepID=A0A9Q1JBY2_SYNKA|nr:hypothetical protein SKAU_G00000080 [Synaphobranchus kaupii]
METPALAPASSLSPPAALVIRGPGRHGRPLMDLLDAGQGRPYALRGPADGTPEGPTWFISTGRERTSMPRIVLSPLNAS